MAITPDSNEKLSIEQAKKNLSAAFHDFDLLEPLRKHPYVVVGSAVTAGAVLGSSGKVIGGLTSLSATLLKLVKPFSGMIAQFATAKVMAATATPDAEIAKPDSSPIEDTNAQAEASTQ